MSTFPKGKTTEGTLFPLRQPFLRLSVALLAFSLLPLWWSCGTSPLADPLPPDPRPLAVCQEGGRWGYVFPDGTWRIPPVFQKASDFRGDLAVVRQRGFYGLINRNGRWIMPATNLRMQIGGDGNVVYQDQLKRWWWRRPDGSRLHISDHLESISLPRHGWIVGRREDGSTVLLDSLGQPAGSFPAGEVRLLSATRLLTREEEGFCLREVPGGELVLGPYADISPMGQGHFVVQEGPATFWWYREGQERSGPYSDLHAEWGQQGIAVRSDRGWHLLGAWPPQIYARVESVGYSVDGQWPVMLNGKWGILGKQGELLQDFSSDSLQLSAGGHAALWQGGDCTLRYPDGRRHEMPGTWTRVAWEQGLWKCWEAQGKVMLADETGRPLLTKSYDQIRPFRNGFAVVVDQGRYGLLDSTFQEQIPPQFQYLGDFVAAEE